MSCGSCYKNTWQQKRSDFMPLSSLAQRSADDYGNTNSVLASTANFVARTSPAFVRPGRPWPYVTVVPYYNNLVSAVVPQGPIDAGTGPLLPPAMQSEMSNGGSAYAYTSSLAASAGSGATPATHWHQTYNTDTYCGCCKHPFSPLPPQGAHLLQDLIMQRQAPIQELLGPTCNSHYQRYY